MIGEKIQICNISKKKEEKEAKKTCLKSKADFFGDPMGTPSGRGEGAEGSERAKEGGGSWWWLVLWLLGLPPPPFPPAALAELLQVLLGQKPDASGHSWLVYSFFWWAPLTTIRGGLDPNEVRNRLALHLVLLQCALASHPSTLEIIE